MKKKSVFAAFVVCTAWFLVSAVPVCAAEEKYAEIYGDTVTLSHELVVDKQATTVHNAKFTFSVAASDAKTTDDPVYLVKGPNGATVTESLTYSNEDVAGAPSDETSGKKRSKKTLWWISLR